MTSPIHGDIATKRRRPEGLDPDALPTSWFAIGTTILRHRWRIVRWTLAGALIAGALAFLKPTVYSASASFIPQGVSDPGRSGLANLAGQLGVALPSGNQTLSPDFYVKLIRSRELLKAVVRDTIAVQEESGKRVPFVELFHIGGNTPQQREDEGILALSRIIAASAARTTGIVEFSVTTKWPSVSVAIANDLINGINEFNQRLRQEQAGAERKFVEGRLAIASSDLRAAEDRLEDFLRTNRSLGSPDLQFARDRLQRDVNLKQGVFTSLTQSYEEVRIREVRDTPVITIVEEPAVPSLPEPSGRLWAILLGILLGGFAGVVLAFFTDSMVRHRQAGDAAANEFAGTLREIKGSVDRLRKKIRR